MSRSSTFRAGFLIAMICLGASCGGLIGYFVARAHTEAQVEAQIDATASDAQRLIGSLITESRSLLATLNATHFQPCTPAEVTYLRKAVYQARHLRDAGRMVNGVMQCSAFFEQGEFPLTPLKPTMIEAGGLSFYRAASPYASTDRAAYIMQRGDFYVVEDPDFEHRLNRFSDNVETTTIDAVTGKRLRPSGKPLEAPLSVLDRNWQGREGDFIYVTRCSDDSPICTTAWARFSAALNGDQRQAAIYTTLGCLAGAFPILLIALVLQRHLTMSKQLLRAIRREKVKVLYQPIVELASKRVVGAEALARWNDEDGSPVNPTVFVRMAEQGGFIRELTELVLRRGLEDFRETLLGDRQFRLNLNVTASDLEDVKFVPMVEDVMAAYRVTPQSVAFEVTEGSTARTQMAIETIHELRRRGHHVEIDDFGTGYSSLSYLRDLSIDAIKIDKSFTQAIGTSAVMGDILPQILSIARALKLLVIVEGIETPEQAAYFADYEGQVQGQGWLFGRPVSAEEFHRRWLTHDGMAAGSD